jgi:hypothetical protein
VRHRFPKLGRRLAGIYVTYGIIVFFGSLGSESHSWWPVFLNPIIWPLGSVLLAASSVSMDVIFPKNPPTWAYSVFDYVLAAFYVGVGAVWVWCLGRVFSILITRIFRVKNESIVV